MTFSSASLSPCWPSCFCLAGWGSPAQSQKRYQVEVVKSSSQAISADSRPRTRPSYACGRSATLLSGKPHASDVRSLDSSRHRLSNVRPAKSELTAVTRVRALHQGLDHESDDSNLVVANFMRVRKWWHSIRCKALVRLVGNAC